jgi:hypothetical protein
MSAPIYTIPVYQIVPTASIDALTAQAHAETNSSDEAGEFFSMAVAIKIPVAQVPPNSVVIIPLKPLTSASKRECHFYQRLASVDAVGSI